MPDSVSPDLAFITSLGRALVSRHTVATGFRRQTVYSCNARLVDVPSPSSLESDAAEEEEQEAFIRRIKSVVESVRGAFFSIICPDGLLSSVV
ncbi:hypothetical protein H6P81_010727 [Aristolochia fimbriata]|uniref:Uncharacterized protein n=1 Tax=Aristolochia fimbriata TaxID=158543 RepID=A0AAV7ESZ2_ARIFI|nr:hypothetical protein H6P81_010727 [Aristolochia fimbriata]